MKHFKKVSLMLAVLCMWVGCADRTGSKGTKYRRV